MANPDVPFSKGHGTGNDFVITADPQDEFSWTRTQVAAVCDRRRGLGADGLLRAVRCAVLPGMEDLATEAEWFMDYRNADGSLAEMCGNGARVFGRYLVTNGLAAAGEFSIATRSGIRALHVPARGDVTVRMGPVTEGPTGVEVVSEGHTWSAAALYAPNPHAVIPVRDVAEAGELRAAPLVPASVFPDGANVEFVQVIGPRHVRMRVHERGVGETLSCGTGACAVAVWHAGHGGQDLPGGIRVDVPGGSLQLAGSSADASLTGPAELVATGKIAGGWWANLG